MLLGVWGVQTHAGSWLEHVVAVVRQLPFDIYRTCAQLCIVPVSVDVIPSPNHVNQERDLVAE